jgi:hypothetical protein
MGVTESKEDQKLQEIWAVVDEDSDEEDKLKKQKKVLTQGVKLAKPAGDTSSSSTTSASSVPTKPISHPESPFPGIRLRTEEDGDAATTKDEETKEQAVEPVAPGDEGEPRTLLPNGAVLLAIDSNVRPPPGQERAAEQTEDQEEEANVPADDKAEPTKVREGSRLLPLPL